MARIFAASSAALTAAAPTGGRTSDDPTSGTTVSTVDTIIVAGGINCGCIKQIVPAVRHTITFTAIYLLELLDENILLRLFSFSRRTVE